MTLSEIKNALVIAHRNEDWDAAKHLSQLKEAEKRKMRKQNFCIVCEIPISTHSHGKNGPRSERCATHARFHRFYSRSLAGFVLMAMAAIAGPTPNTGQVTAAWQNPNPAGCVTNFTLYYGTASGVYTLSRSTTNLNLTVTNLVRNTTYFFAATCTDTNGLESDYSNEASVTIPKKPNPPNNLTAQ